MRQFKLEGYQVDLRKELGKKQFEEMSRFFKEELDVSLEEVIGEVKVYQMTFLVSMECFTKGFYGFYFNKSREVWTTNVHSNNIVHELVHAVQYKRKGVINVLKKGLSQLSSKMLDRGITCFYKLDLFEKEARRITEKFSSK